MTDTLTESLVILIVGVGGVFVSLSFFSFLIWGMKKIDNLFTIKKKKKSVAVKHAKPAAQEEDTELIAVLTAAAMEILQHPVRIRHIKYLQQQQTGGSWAVSGRSTVMSSHNISKRNK
jgi:sodium pump decarboxylase gamma subunit